MTDQTPDDDMPGFAVPVPAGLLAGLQEQHDRCLMDRESRQLRLNRFLDSLDVDQLLALRDILNHDSTSAMNNYWDGQVAAILRLIHHVDPGTGQPEPTISDLTGADGDH